MRFQNVLLCLVSISYTAFSAPRREISRFCTWSSKVQCKKTQQGYCWKLFLISLIILTFFPKTQFYPSSPRTQHKYTTHKINTTQSILRKSVLLVTKLTLLELGSIAKVRETWFVEKLEGWFTKPIITTNKTCRGSGP